MPGGNCNSSLLAQWRAPLFLGRLYCGFAQETAQIRLLARFLLSGGR
jgi:hypothetical protein